MFVATLKGSFGAVEGTLTIDEDDPSRSNANASIHVTTIRTGIALRDAHLRSGQFFHVSEFPTMTFRSTQIDQIAAARWDVTGELTIRDVTKAVVLKTVFLGLLPTRDSSRHAKFTASSELDRREFGLGLHGPGGLVGDRVSVTLEIRATSLDGSVL